MLYHHCDCGSHTSGQWRRCQESWLRLQTIANLKDCVFHGAFVDQPDFTSRLKEEDIPKLQASSRTLRTRSARRRTDRQICESCAKVFVRSDATRENGKLSSTTTATRSSCSLVPCWSSAAHNPARRHRCLFCMLRTIPGEWRFVGPEGEVALRISGRFRSNSGNMLYAALLAGAVIGLVPTFVAGRDLAEGRLVSLMPDYRPVESQLSVIYQVDRPVWEISGSNGDGS